MKKNIMMRMAAVLLVGVLLTTSVIGGTFAKYVTSDTETDTARVAKWGVEVDVVIDGAFATEYDIKTATDDLNGTAIAKSVVNVAADKNLVAPGTEGTLLAKAAISGAPEVAVNITKVADLKLAGWEVGGVYYCPLIINGIKGLDYSSMAEFEAAVEASLAVNVNCQANADLAQDTTVAWEWPFYVSAENDVKDTALGNLATAPTIEFTYTVTVTQID